MLFSCEGYGTDAIVYLKVSVANISCQRFERFNVTLNDNFPQAFSDEANELLPIFNKTSSRFYKATVPTGDWSNQVTKLKKKKPVIA